MNCYDTLDVCTKVNQLSTKIQTINEILTSLKTKYNNVDKKLYDAIDVLEVTVGKLLKDVNSLLSKNNGFKLQGEFSNTKSYKELDLVTYQGSSYAAKTDCIGIIPTNVKYWQLISTLGSKGDKGNTGKSAYECYLEKAGINPLTQEQWLYSLIGNTGKSAYECYLASTSDSPKKTESLWLKSLDGKDGKNGLSAYDIYVAQGGTLSEIEWLASLKGSDGTSIIMKANAETCTNIGDGYIDSNGHLQMLTNPGPPKEWKDCGLIKGDKGDSIIKTETLYLWVSTGTTPTSSTGTWTSSIGTGSSGKVLWEMLKYTVRTSSGSDYYTYSNPIQNSYAGKLGTFSTYIGPTGLYTGTIAADKLIIGGETALKEGKLFSVSSSGEVTCDKLKVNKINGHDVSKMFTDENTIGNGKIGELYLNNLTLTTLNGERLWVSTPALSNHKAYEAALNYAAECNDGLIPILLASSNVNFNNKLYKGTRTITGYQSLPMGTIYNNDSNNFGTFGYIKSGVNLNTLQNYFAEVFTSSLGNTSVLTILRELINSGSYTLGSSVLTLKIDVRENTTVITKSTDSQITYLNMRDTTTNEYSFDIQYNYPIELIKSNYELTKFDYFSLSSKNLWVNSHQFTIEDSVENYAYITIDGVKYKLLKA